MYTSHIFYSIEERIDLTYGSASMALMRLLTYAWDIGGLKTDFVGSPFYPMGGWVLYMR